MRAEQLGRIARLHGILLCALATGSAFIHTASAAAETGDLFDLRAPLAPLGKRLADEGVYLKGFYQGTLYANVFGGNKRATVYYNDVLYGADFDLQKMAGLDRTVVHFSLNSRFGGFPQGVNDLSGSAMGFLQGAGPANVTRLNELTLEQSFLGGKLRFVMGRTTLADYFGTSDLYCRFVSTICSNIAPFNWSADSNAPFWPISTWAGAVSIRPTKNVYLRAGVSESNPDQYPHGGFPWSHGWSTRDATGVFVPFEIGYTTSAGEDRYPWKFDIGFYYDSSDFPDFRYNTQGQSLVFFGGTPASNGSQTVVYAQAQQTIWRPDPARPQGLTPFAAVLFNTSGRALVHSYAHLGLVLRGTAPSRPNDSIGLLVMHNVFNRRASGAVNDRIAAQGLSGHVPNSEQIIEVNYDFELAPGIHLKPYTDYTFHPDQNLFTIPHPDPQVRHSWAVGLQLTVSFNEAFGLPVFSRAD
jgi:porin